jgi:hypothetical protein
MVAGMALIVWYKIMIQKVALEYLRIKPPYMHVYILLSCVSRLYLTS